MISRHSLRENAVYGKAHVSVAIAGAKKRAKPQKRNTTLDKGRKESHETRSLAEGLEKGREPLMDEEHVQPHNTHLEKGRKVSLKATKGEHEKCEKTTERAKMKRRGGEDKQYEKTRERALMEHHGQESILSPRARTASCQSRKDKIRLTIGSDPAIQQESHSTEDLKKQLKTHKKNRARSFFDAFQVSVSIHCDCQ